MARTLNKVMLIGNVGNDPEINHTPSGIPVASFRLATSENRKDREGNVIEHTDWHTIVAWRGLADIVERLVFRSSRIFVEGKLQTRVYEDKQGNRRRIVEIIADTVLILDNKHKHEDEYEEIDFKDKQELENNSNYSYDSDSVDPIENIPF